MHERGYFEIEGFPRGVGELPTCLCAYCDGMIDRTLRSIQQFLGFLAKALRHGCDPFCECRREHNRSLSHRRPRTTAWPVMAGSCADAWLIARLNTAAVPTENEKKQAAK